MLDKDIYPDNHPELPNKIGVLLLNVGTPDSPDYFSVRRYLKEFLSDRRMIELNPWLWSIILNFFVLPFRCKPLAHKYEEVWIKDSNEGPLVYYTRMQAEKVDALIKKASDKEVIVDYAMRYGNPSIESKINKLLDNGCNKIIFVPMYPQYCAATTASTCDAIYDILNKKRWQPKVSITDPYHDNNVYIKALVASVKKHLANIDFVPDAILSSYHGIPQEYFDKGDPYPCFCRKTNRLFSAELKNQDVNINTHISFQSRFGYKPWVKPYTEDVLKELFEQGIKKLVVISPGFSADCLETIEEIDMQYRDMFLDLGGEKFSTVPCLNDSEESINLIHHLIKQYIEL